MTDLHCYLAIDRVLTMAHGTQLPPSATGTVLFADINGFTALTEALVQQFSARRGAEELTILLNRFYDMLIGQVHQYGGSVVSFSGDAITCWFDNDSGLRAATCALEMHRLVSERANIEVRYPLTIKTAISYGNVHRITLGDPQIQLHDVLAGPAIESLAATARYVQRNEIAVDAYLAQQLAASVSWRIEPVSGEHVALLITLPTPAMPSPWPVIPLPLDEQLLRPWILPAVYARIQAGVEPFLAELRPATTLMLTFGGGEHSDNSSYAGLKAYIRWVQCVIDTYGGALIDVTFGDHGDFLYATFGVPIANDDASIRAISAALELCVPPAGLPGATMARIGIASGQVRCGPYGSMARRTYGVMGDTANLAARLMDVAAPGTIICDEPTYQQAREHWMFDVLPPVQAKGKSALVAIYRPTGVRQHATTQRTNTLIGREAEIGLLRQHLVGSAAGAHSVLIVEGEAGIGKSRLINELLGMAHKHGVFAIMGSSEPINNRPYQAWRTMIIGYLDLVMVEPTFTPTPEARVQNAVMYLAPELAERSPLLNDLLDLALPDTNYTQTLDLAERAERLAELLAALLDSPQFMQPLALIIDDAQRLDLLSWQLTVRVSRALTQRRAGLLFLLALRPFDAGHPARAQLKALLMLPHAQYLRLEVLDDGAITAVAAQRLGLLPAALSAAVAAFVRERAGGNPLFAEELAALLNEQGLIHREDDTDLRLAANLLPATLHGLLLARIDRLTPDEQLTLKIAAVIGQTFGHTILQFVYERLIPQRAAALVQILRSLAAKDYTWLEVPEPDLTYRFRHALIQEAAYESLLYEQRRELHRAVAGWYEATFGASVGDIITHKRADPLAPYAALLAHHYHNAEDASNERHYTVMLGEQLYNISAFLDAAACFSRAQDLIPNTDSGPHIEHGRLLGHMARTRLRLGDTPNATRLFIESLATAELVGDHAGASNACYELGALAARQADLIGAQNYLERSLALAQMSGDVGAQAQALDRLGAICIDRGDEAGALTYYQQAIAFGQRRRRR